MKDTVYAQADWAAMWLILKPIRRPPCVVRCVAHQEVNRGRHNHPHCIYHF